MAYIKETNSFTCDITGSILLEKNGWIGNDNVHLSNEGAIEIIEQWIDKNNNGFLVPMFVKYLELRFTKRFKRDRYIPVKIRKQVLEKYKHKCVSCGSEKSLEIDHIHPISKGGLTEVMNLQVLCKPCNLIKSNKVPSK